jgi:hypothetical protein
MISDGRDRASTWFFKVAHSSRAKAVGNRLPKFRADAPKLARHISCGSYKRRSIRHFFGALCCENRQLRSRADRLNLSAMTGLLGSRIASNEFRVQAQNGHRRSFELCPTTLRELPQAQLLGSRHFDRRLGQNCRVGLI